MTSQARIVHHIPGRIRIEVSERRGDQEFFAMLSDQLAQSGQVTRARGNAAASSLAIEYSGTFEDLLPQLQQCSLQLSDAGHGALAGPGAAGTALPAMPRFGLGRDLNPMALAGAVFGAVGLVQTARGEIMMPALSAFWYAASALRLAQLPAIGPGADLAAKQANQTLS